MTCFVQENAAAYFIKLDEEDLKYLENTFSKDKVCCESASPWRVV